MVLMSCFTRPPRDSIEGRMAELPCARYSWSGLVQILNADVAGGLLDDEHRGDAADARGGHDLGLAGLHDPDLGLDGGDVGVRAAAGEAETLLGDHRLGDLLGVDLLGLGLLAGLLALLAG